VLVLNDLGIVSSPGFAEIDQAIFAGLQKSPYQIEFYHESLELTLFPDEVSQHWIREEFIRKYSDRKLDVIIAAGSDSLKFIAGSHERFLRDTPIIFCAILGQIPDGLTPDVHFTGVVGKLQPEKTLNVALRLLPGTRHVVVTGGMGKFDYRWEAIAKQSFHNYESKLDFTYLTDLTMPTLLDRLRNLPNNTIVYHTAMSRDAAGNRFIDSAQAVPLVAGAANAPVFVVDDVDLVGGTVGGDLVNWADDARVAAGMAVRVLNGEKPQDIPIVTSNNVYMFDWRALRHWGIKESALPPGSIVLNRQPTVWESFRWYIVGGISLIVLEALLISALLWHRARRRKAEADLTAALEVAQESEQRFRHVANAAPVMIWMSGTDKLCTYVNQTWLDLTGRRVTAELGNGWLESIHAEDVKPCFDIYSHAFDRREPFTMQYRVRRHDGDYRWVLDRGVPRFNADDSFAGYIGSCVDITDRKQAEETLSSVSRRLIDAQEQERTRIARELHDDINQRIAMLAVDLDVLQQEPPDSSVELQNRLDELRERLSEIGSEIQAISHRLHSSKLEYLGLVAACKGFCKEVAEHNKVTVDFTAEDIPSAVPQEVSLCLFRVLQESLNNGIKHSGAEHFDVQLRGVSGDIQLKVHDHGIGFDAAAAIVSRGLGLISMRERVSLVKGTLLITSKPMGGTEITVRVPVVAKGASQTAVGAA